MQSRENESRFHYLCIYRIEEFGDSYKKTLATFLPTVWSHLVVCAVRGYEFEGEQKCQVTFNDVTTLAIFKRHNVNKSACLHNNLF